MRKTKRGEGPHEASVWRQMLRRAKMFFARGGCARGERATTRSTGGGGISILSARPGSGSRVLGPGGSGRRQKDAGQKTKMFLRAPGARGAGGGPRAAVVTVGLWQIASLAAPARTEGFGRPTTKSYTWIMACLPWMPGSKPVKT